MRHLNVLAGIGAPELTMAAPITANWNLVFLLFRMGLFQSSPDKCVKSFRQMDPVAGGLQNTEKQYV